MTVATTQSPDGLQRRHAVVLHADIADYSRLMADDAAATVATVRAYQQLVTEIVADAGGTLINFVGDSFLATFDDAPTAMRAAVSICTAVGERNRELPRQRRTWFRLGLDAGEIVVADDGRYFGETLNVAARIQAIAQVGGVNVTEAIYRELDEPALRLVGLGERRLKNIPEMVRIYRLAGVGADIADDAPATVGFPSVAVMPTVTGGDATNRAIADALRLDLAQALDALPGLRVIDVGPDLADTSVDLGAVDANYVLESRVVRSGTRVRAYVKLDELATMNLVWAERWQGSTDDIFALQDAVTADTVRAMEVELVIGAPATIYHEELDADSRDAVYRGLHELAAGTRNGWHRARALLTLLADRRPDLISGTALGAFVCWWGAIQGFSDDPDRELEAAAHYAGRGVELDDPTGLSHLVVAALRLHAGQDPESALADAQTSLQRRPTCDVSFGVLGSVRRYLGDWQSAVEACERAQQLSPLYDAWFDTIKASAYYVGERYHDAALTAERVVDRRLGNLEALLVLAAAQQALGLTRRAHATVGMLLDRFPDVRRDDLRRKHPFRDRAILDRWLGHLADAGVP